MNRKLKLIRETICNFLTGKTKFIERTENCHPTDKTIGGPGCPGIAPEEPKPTYKRLTGKCRG